MGAVNQESDNAALQVAGIRYPQIQTENEEENVVELFFDSIILQSKKTS
jgi:hypothetical protein